MKKSFLLLAMAAAMVPATAFADYHPAEEGVTFTYCQGGQSSSLGNGSANSYAVAMKLTDPDFVGAKVKGIKVMYAWNTSYGPENYRVWAAEKLATKMDFLQKTDIDIDTIWYGYGDFEQPVTIPADGLYLGYSFDMRYEGYDEDITHYPICFTDPAGIKDAFWVQSGSAGRWKDYGPQYGCAPIMVFLEGPFKANAVQLNGAYGEGGAAVGEPVRLSFEIVNKGESLIHSLQYTYTIDGETHYGSTDVESELTTGKTGYVILDFPPMDAEGTHDLALDITGINGQPNEAAVTKCETSYTVTLTRKHPVMEEQTGVGCGFCPRGWVAIKALKQRYPNFIAMAYHDEEMKLPAGHKWPFYLSGIPGCKIDRKDTYINPLDGQEITDDPDPYNGYNREDEFTFGMEPVFNIIAKEKGYAAMKVESQWNADSTNLTVNATVNFKELPDGACKLAYALVQNKICHPGYGNFAQHNYYSGCDYGTDMRQELCVLPREIDGFVYDDVPIYGKDLMGVEGSLPESLELNTDYTHSYEIPLKDATSYVEDGEEFVQNPAHMEVVLMLIDKNGHIINGRLAKAGSSNTAFSGINNTVAEQQVEGPVEYYNIQGQRVEVLGHGLYIKRQGNKATKIIL